MAYIDKERIQSHLRLKCLAKYPDTFINGLLAAANEIGEMPTADVVDIETIKAWLYEMAINNVGCKIDGDFSDACEEIISRLYGLKNFAQERRTDNDL